jgi:phenylpropionate dioxygenase-like ring-hydroxylating dioxygenase large terminal subunit
MTYSPNLFKCWHPVAYSYTLADKPIAAKLLDRYLVVWRSSDGAPHAMDDLCIHRGVALSLGEVKGDEIMCPYHGWRYNRQGACTLIPQRRNDTIPSKARVPSHRCQERYGLIWVALEVPLHPLPEIPEFENGSWKIVDTGPFPWHSDASRQLENFTDFGHFPWVHPGLLGDVNRPEVPEHSVTTQGHVLHYTIVRPEAPNSDDFPVFANDDVVKPERRSRYEVHLPYTITLRLGWGGEKGMVYLFVSQPMSERQCQGYCIIGRNYDLHQPDTVLQEFENVIFGQDRRIVESQRPEQVPFDLAAELHMKFDAVAVAYRRAMKANGFEPQ